ncbi:MAG: 2-oxoisovalerate dehydrogenase E2 component (dihydrolipoyl transacylase) [Gammaproteobacteria bacterium]|jgi:2-oxoisovalerate dehydrogenase E2 component (dihydrolipoyl transacylase)
MSLFEMKLPDVGEGVAEAELVEWLVAVGDQVTPETVVAEVLTDKATVEVSSPVTGAVAILHGEPGDVLAVGGILIGIETDSAAVASPHGDDIDAPPETDEAREPAALPPPSARVSSADRPSAAPAVRARARDLDLDLGTIQGTGSDGRIVHADLDRVLLDRGSGPLSHRAPSPSEAGSDGRRIVAVRGVRRRIAERLSDAWHEIPHITYVDDIDVTELELLRVALNARSDGRTERLTLLPFIARAVVLAVAELPELNAHYDHPAETLTTFDAVHIGIATQTDDGLRVAVVHHAEQRAVASLATEISRMTALARDGSAARADLSGSTITITSLGAIGGIATTPILNPPEVAIVGVNKMETRPVWRDGAFQPRQKMNLSSSFDHRMVDGWVAATFVQHIKRSLETPALLFVDDI